MEKAPVVVDARKARDPEEAIPQHLLPHRLHLPHLREETMPPDVEAVAAVTGRLRNPPNDPAAFEHGHRHPRPRRLVGRRQPRRARPGNDHPPSRARFSGHLGFSPRFSTAINVAVKHSPIFFSSSG